MYFCVLLFEDCYCADANTSPLCDDHISWPKRLPARVNWARV
jgi:hypothetical protein